MVTFLIKTVKPERNYECGRGKKKAGDTRGISGLKSGRGCPRPRGTYQLTLYVNVAPYMRGMPYMKFS